MREIPPPIKQALRPMWRMVRPILYKFVDLFDSIRGGRNPLVPPRSMIFVGDGDYEKIGNEFFEYFREFGKLKPSDKVLDVGCGIGRMSLPLTTYLTGGEYYGFDIVKMGIDWCNKNVASRYPNFHYHHSDIYNKMYNPGGREKSSEYRFIYEDDFFDFVFLTSVFTHMLTADVNRYLGEISRVMKTGSRCLISCFLINEESQSFVEKGTSSQRLVYPLDEHSYTKDKSIPESAVGYKERYFTSICDKNRLKVDGNIHYGGWCGRTEYTSYQDIVIVRKY